MNKTKMILAGIGGAIGVVALALGFLVWQAFSAKSAAVEGDYETGTEGLDAVVSRAQTLTRKPIYPCAASVEAIVQNQKLVEDWRKEGLELAARGDRIFEKTTAPKFKAYLVADAKRLTGLPGGVGGNLMKPEFAFGPFKDYITEGKMPSEAELPELQRKWDDVVTVAELMSTNGVTELVDVQFAVANREQGTGNRDQEKKGRGKREEGRGSRKLNGQKANASSLLPVSSSHSYVFTFTAKPPAFINVLNALASSERFITVDDFTFARSGDAIASALGGGDEKKAAEQASSGRRGRGRNRRGAEQPDAKAQRGEDAAGAAAGKNGLVTDPLMDPPMTVTMTVTVHDFRSLEEAVAAPRSEDAAGTVKKGASK